jgi:hypothetical protein
MFFKSSLLYIIVLITLGLDIHPKIQPEDVLYKKTDLLTSTTVPLKKAGNLLLVDAIVDGVSGVFVLDTGAPGLVLNATYFRDGLPTYGSTGGGVTGSNIQRSTKKVERFELSGFVFEDIKADVINLRHVENTKKTKILGLIGARFMEDFEVIINMKQLSMKLIQVDRKGEAVEPYLDKNVYSIQHKAFLFNNVIVSYIPIADKRVCFCLDTGAERNVIDNQSHKKILETISITGRSRLSGASSERIEVLFGIMNDFSIGDYKFDGMSVIMMDLATMRNSFNVNIGGMLGYDFFKQGVFKINLRKKLMSIALYD